jgi:excisionase family DNA binding protein
MEQEFLTIKEAAVVFACHPNTIRRAIRLGYIVTIRVGKGPRSPYRISRKSIDDIHELIISQHRLKADRSQIK